MKYLRLFILIIVISATALLSWLYLSNKTVENIPRKATLVLNTKMNVDEGYFYE